MKPGFNSLDLFCRINVQAEIPFQDFVALIARCAGGASHMNAVRSQTLDISVFENDDYDAEMALTGNDRWLYYRYTLEIDPIEGVLPGDYVAAIGALLNSLWSSRMDAVASCDFEEQLPRNVRRLKWARIPRPHSGSAGGTEMVGVRDIVIPARGDSVALDACARPVQRHWPQARFEDVLTGEKYPSYGDIPFGRVHELFVYPNAQAEAAWNADSPDSPLNSMLHLILCPDCVTAVLDDPTAANIQPILESIRASLRMDILNTYAEAA